MLNINVMNHLWYLTAFARAWRHQIFDAHNGNLKKGTPVPCSPEEQVWLPVILITVQYERWLPSLINIQNWSVFTINHQPLATFSQVSKPTLNHHRWPFFLLTTKNHLQPSTNHHWLSSSINREPSFSIIKHFRLYWPSLLTSIQKSLSSLT